MKTSQDPRHKNRREIVKILFAETYSPQLTKNEEVKEILKGIKKIDKQIEKSAPQWPVDKLNRIDLVVLRLAVYELNKGNNPPKVIIDEAVELAKEFGSENSGSFVNGVLGTIFKKEKNERYRTKN